MVSGKHLAVKINAESRVVMKDLDTTNGTYLNGNKIQESHLYIEDFIQIGKIRIKLDETEMSVNELKLHKRDFERTNVTFVPLGANIEGFDEDEEDEFGVRKQKTLLAKIRRMKEGEQTETVSEQQPEKVSEESDEERNDQPAKKPTNKKKKALKTTDPSQQTGLVRKLKGLFKK